MSKENGLTQVSAYAQLSDWKPDNLAGWKVGDLAEVDSLGRVRVVALHPPSLIEVQTDSGRTCRCGWRALRKVDK